MRRADRGANMRRSMQHPAFPTVLARARRASTGRHGLAWTITAGVLCIDAVWLALAGWSVSGRGLAVLAMGLAACLAPLSVARYRHDARIAATTSFCALLLLFQAAAATLSYLVVSTNAALHDAALHDWDRARARSETVSTGRAMPARRTSTHPPPGRSPRRRWSRASRR